jgi:hypothetical protein
MLSITQVLDYTCLSEFDLLHETRTDIQQSPLVYRMGRGIPVVFGAGVSGVRVRCWGHVPVAIPYPFATVVWVYPWLPVRPQTRVDTELPESRPNTRNCNVW